MDELRASHVQVPNTRLAQVSLQLQSPSLLSFPVDGLGQSSKVGMLSSKHLAYCSHQWLHVAVPIFVSELCHQLMLR